MRFSVTDRASGCSGVAILDHYVEEAEHSLARYFQNDSVHRCGLRIIVHGDLASLRGTADTMATVQFRLDGEWIIYCIEGKISLGRRSWLGLAAALLLYFGENMRVLVFPGSGVALPLSEALCLVTSTWYLISFPYFARLIRTTLCRELSDLCSSVAPKLANQKVLS